VRAKNGSGSDPANRFLDHGNYLAYGLGATAAWVLGLPHGLAVLHGKTRRGGLVFDIADLIKDAVILPQAFISDARRRRAGFSRGLHREPRAGRSPRLHDRHRQVHRPRHRQASAMNILLISQCSKNALTETRRILDQFAERRGDRSWQTAITQQGLDTLYRLLRKTARKNTAVACHWIRGKDHSELLWVVGDARQFNARGRCPPTRPNATSCAVRERLAWPPGHSPAHVPGGHAARPRQGLPGLSGAASARAHYAGMYRHEWISLRLFQAFVGDSTDEAWLQRLIEPSASDDASWLAG
jgi:hypothetical protein